MAKAYNGKFDTVAEYCNDAQNRIESAINEGYEFSNLLFEPISGCGGQVPLMDGYLKEMVPWLRNKGMLIIADEVQVGFGRLGEWFWGFEMQGIVPDIVVLGKPMGNGFPIAAVVTTAKIAERFNNGMEFFSSFGGNPVSVSAAKAVLDILFEEGLQSRACEVGEYFKNALIDLKQRHSCIGNVRGHGLFLGIEFMETEGISNHDICQTVKNALKENYILTGSDGKNNETLKIKPPLCFNMENAKKVVHRLEEILKSKPI